MRIRSSAKAMVVRKIHISLIRSKEIGSTINIHKTFIHLKFMLNKAQNGQPLSTSRGDVLIASGSSYRLSHDAGTDFSSSDFKLSNYLPELGSTKCTPSGRVTSTDPELLKRENLNTSNLVKSSGFDKETS
jgi:hypothetical protein